MADNLGRLRPDGSDRVQREDYLPGMSEAKKARKILAKMAKDPDHPMMLDEMYQLCYGKRPENYFVAKTRMCRVLRIMKDKGFLTIYNVKMPVMEAGMKHRSRRRVYTISDKGRYYLKTVDWTNLKTGKLRMHDKPFE